MAKGSRKRANTVSPNGKTVKKAETKQKEVVFQPIQDTMPVRTLNQRDFENVKGVFLLSNNVAALMKKYSESDMQVRNIRVFANKLEKEGNKAGPLLQRVSENLFMPIRDIPKSVKDLRDEADILEKANKITKGQIEHRFDEYVDALQRHKSFIEGLLAKVKDTKTKVISGQRTGGEIKKAEEELMVKEFDELTKADKELIQDIVKNNPPVDEVKTKIASNKKE